MAEFDPASLGAVPVEEEFDPASLGAVAVEEDFDPASLGAIPINQGPSVGDLARRIPAGIAQTGAESAAGVLKTFQDVAGAIPGERTIEEANRPRYDELKSHVDRLSSEFAEKSKALSFFDISGKRELSKEYVPRITALQGFLSDLETNPDSALTTATQFMRDVAERSKGDYGVDPARDEAFLSKVASGVGSLVPAIASGPAAPATVAAMMGEGARKEAETAGADQSQQDIAFYANAAVGALSEALLGVPALFRSAKAAGIPEATFRAMAKVASMQALKQGLREGGQEAMEGAAQDAIAKYIADYDEKRNPFDIGKRLEEFAVGAVIGAPTGAATQLAASLDAQQQAIDIALEESKAAEPPVTSAPPSTPSEPIKTIPTPQEAQPTAQYAQSLRTNEGQIPQTGDVDVGVQGEGGPDLQLETPPEPSGTELPQPPVQEEKVSPHPPQTAGDSIVSTGILGEDGKPLTGEQWNSPHADIIKQNPELALIDDIENRKGFIIQDANGRQRFVGRKQALEVGQKAGQVDIEKVYDPEGHGLISEALVPIEASPKSTGVMNAEDAAQSLQPFFTQAVDAARTAGAIDPESAASQAQIDLSKQVSEGKTQLDNPQAIFLEAARRQARKQQEKEGARKRGGKAIEPIETAPEPSVTRGPRADVVSEEDIQSIDAKIETLPEQQKRVMRALTEDPDLTDSELAEQTGMTEGAVKQAKARARQTLRDFISKQGIGANLGPGAANIEEALAQYEERKFGKRLQETEEIAPEIRKETGDRYYEIIPNRVTAERATELIETHGTEQIEDNIRDEKSDLSFADRVTVGQILIKKYNEQYKAERESNPEQARKTLDRASNLAEWAADFGTRLGQGVQAFAMWMRLAAQGKLRTFEKLVKAKRDNFTRDNRSDIDEIKDVVNGEGTSHQKVQRLRRLKNPTAKKVKSRVGRIAQAAKDGKLTDEKFYEASGDALGLPVFSPEVAAEIQRLASIVDAAPEGMPKMEAMRDLNTYIARQKGYDPSDLLFGIYYGNILSGTGTHLVNLVDTAINVMNETAVLAIQNPRAAAKIAAALGRGAARGNFDALMAILKGRKITDGKFAEDPFFMETAEFGKKGGVPIKTGTKFGRAAKAISELPIASPLRAWKYVGRLMSATDALAFRSSQEAKSAQLAWRMANDPASARTIEQILGYDRMPEFQRQAESEGYTGYQKQARATELMIMSRPAELQKAATDFASEGTYNVKPYGVIGTISNTIESASRKIPPLKLIVPFTRIVGNVLNRGINNSPWGYVRALRGKAGLETDPLTLKKYSPEERSALMVRAHVSMAMITTLAALHATGVIAVHGGGPSDPEKKRQLRQTGWKPYTVQVGDKYYNTAYSPWGIVMAAMGNYFDSQKYQDLSAKSALDKATYVLLSVAGSMFNQSFLTGLSNFFDILSEKTPGEQASAARRFAAQTTSSAFVPLSSLAKDVESWVSEPNIPKASTLSEALISNIPFASQGLRPQLNALGEPMKSNRSRFISDRTDDPVWRMVSDKGLRIPVPNVFFDDPDSQYEYVQEQGKLLRKWIEVNMSRLKNADSKQAQVMIENASDSFRERSRNRLILKGAKKKQKTSAITDK